MSLWLVTLAELKAELGITDTTDDAVLTEWIEGLQARFDTTLERTLARAASATEYFDGGEKWLLLRRFPVESIASIYVDADAVWGADTLLDSDDYRLDAVRGRVAYGAGENLWPRGFYHIKVTYAGGYVAAGDTPGAGQTAMPDDLRRAAFLQLGFEWRNRLNLGKQSVSQQGAAVSLAPAALLSEVRAILDTYRRV